MHIQSINAVLAYNKNNLRSSKTNSNSNLNFGMAPPEGFIKNGAKELDEIESQLSSSAKSKSKSLWGRFCDWLNEDEGYDPDDAREAEEQIRRMLSDN